MLINGSMNKHRVLREWRRFLISWRGRTAATIFLLLLSSVARAAAEGSSVSLWHDAALSGIRDSQLPPPAVARALAVMDACVYDAWAAYDQKAVGTLLGGALRRPSSERTLASKEETVSYA